MSWHVLFLSKQLVTSLFAGGVPLLMRLNIMTNTLAPGRCSCNLQLVVSKLMLRIDILIISLLSCWPYELMIPVGGPTRGFAAGGHSILDKRFHCFRVPFSGQFKRHALLGAVLCKVWTCSQVNVARPNYRQFSSIRRTQSQNINVSRLVLLLSLPNPLKPSVKLRMKM